MVGVLVEQLVAQPDSDIRVVLERLDGELEFVQNTLLRVVWQASQRPMR